MKKRDSVNKKVPRNVPRKLTFKVEALEYSEVKLYIPKDKKGKITLTKYWYVWFNYKNPETGVFDEKSKFNYKLGINRYKTIAARKTVGKNMVAAFTELLQQGFNPFENIIVQDQTLSFETQALPLAEAITKALQEKKTEWSESTYKSDHYRVLEFIDFAKVHNFDTIPSTELKRGHIVEFLKTLKARNLSNTSINNYRTTLSGVISKMVDNQHLEYNIVKNIPKLNARAVKNHPFSNNQVQDIKKHLQKHNPYLLDYIRVMAYSFLRNREVLRLQVQSVDLKNRILSIKTKTEQLEKVFITDQLLTIFEKMKLKNYGPTDYIFTRSGTPGTWNADLKTKTKFFSDHFRSVKKNFHYGSEYTIYSFRHTFALNIFENHLKEGCNETEAMLKMLPMTRHKTLEALGRYLREKKKMLPKNYSNSITIDL